MSCYSLCMHEGRGWQESAGAKTGYGIMCYKMKEGTGGSRWVRRRGMTLCAVIRRKGPAGAGGCEDGV